MTYTHGVECIVRSGCWNRWGCVLLLHDGAFRRACRGIARYPIVLCFLDLERAPLEFQ